MQPDVYFTQLNAHQVTLRRLQERDIVPLWQYRNHPDSADQGSWPLPFNHTDAQRLEHEQRSCHPGIPGQEFIGVVSHGQTLVGEWSLTTDTIDLRQVDVTLCLALPFRTRAYGEKILATLFTYLFGQLGKNKIRMFNDAHDTAWMTILGGFGMVQEAHLLENAYIRNRWCDLYLYTLLAREWQTLYKSLNRSLAHTIKPNKAV